MKPKFTTLLLLLLLPAWMLAQVSLGGTPKSDDLSLNLRNSNVPTVQMPGIDLQSLRAEDAINDQIDGLYRFAVPFQVNYDARRTGLWETLPNGGKLWRLNISAPSAINMNLIFSKMYLPQRSRLFIYNQDKSEVLGAFSSHNNRADGGFATALINDDFLTVEYYEPPGVRGQASLVISQVAHGYRGIDKENRRIDESGNCQVNVNCSPEGDGIWQDHKKGVARMVINGSGLCSGSLIHNTNNDCTPYFLTADHCIDGTYDAITAPNANIVFYWNYERTGCANTGSAPLNQTSSGAVVVANDDATNSADFALLRINSNPQDFYDVYFNGWDRSGNTGTGGKGIHHPAGDIKKISTHSSNPSNTSGGRYWELFWDATTNGHSVTEGGSSGSPLFRTNGRILGQLYGGSSLNCSDPANDLGRYGQIAYSWTNNNNGDNRRRLDAWLDPGNTGATTLDGVAGTACGTPKVLVSASSTSVPENNQCNDNTDITVSVVLSSQPNATTNVNLSLSGSANNPSDYTFGSTSFSFTTANWDTPQIRTLTVIADAYVETNETVVIDNTPSGSDVVAGSSITITIINDDNAPSTGGTTNSVMYTETFDDVTGWTQATSTGTVNDWSIGTAAGLTGNAAYISSNDNNYTYNNTTSIARLQSETINSSGYSNLQLTFDYICNGEVGSIYYDYGSLYYSIDDGTNWVQLGSEIQGVTSVSSFSIALPADAENITTLKIAFRWDNDDSVRNQPPFSVDNVQITGDISSPAVIQTAINTGSGFAEHYLGPNSTVHFYDQATGNIMATIANGNSHDYGCTRVEVDRAGTNETAWIAGFNITNKTFKVTPSTNNPNGVYDITLYYADSEISTFAPNSMAKATTAIDNGTNNAGNSEVIAFVENAITGGTTYTASFTSGFSGFGLSDAPPLDPLPVELVGLTARPNRENIKLEWATAGERNNKGFEVQRSINARDGFESIGWVNGNGNTSLETEYEFTDANVRKGVTYYYRLKQIDFDGQFDISDVVSARVTGKSVGMNIFPNPVKKIAHVFVSGFDTDFTLNILDVQGRVVYTKTYRSDLETIEIDVDFLATGVYILNVQSDTKSLTDKLIIE